MSEQEGRSRRTPNPVERARLALDFGKRYRAGAGIRKIAEETGWSYGFVQKVLVQAGVRRRRCGARPAAERTTGRVAS